MTKKWLLLGLFGLGLVVTPYLACSSSSQAESVETYSEADVKAALLGTWQGTAELDGESFAFSLTLERTPWQRPAHANLVVVGTLTSENPAFNGSLDGSFDYPHGFSKAALALRLDNGKTLRGTLEGDTLSDGRVDSAAQVGTFGLTRP
jgi:hypothetical protein